MTDLLDLPPRGDFPPHWGEPPTFGDSPERRRWIAEHARRDGGRSGRSPMGRRMWLEERREDPSAARERAAAETRMRLLREELAAMLRRCP
ncbi:hypothetical protein [Streptomyces sp. LN245]|uniref:hypothetical protein n=1 Tax=Streptomyces sp. LN245 TaxID=3112975 RepID=UPI0037206F97